MPSVIGQRVTCEDAPAIGLGVACGKMKICSEVGVDVPLNDHGCVSERL